MNMNIEHNSFETLNLSDELLKGVYLYGFSQPSNIQIKGIQSIGTGKDCILQSQSGTGKTATYLLGILNRLDILGKKQNNLSIIITPTRELANQVYNVAVNLNKFTNYKIGRCIGGIDLYTTKNEIKDASLIIGTLGRIYHMINDKKINYNNIKVITLDEADDILSDGINEKLETIFNNLNNSQIILISATMTYNVFSFSKKFIKNEPIEILLKNNEVILDLISQFYLDVEIEEQKFDTLLDLYNLVSTSQAIIFCNTIKKIEWLEENLKTNNFPITVIHSNMTQIERNNIVQEFRDGKTRLLLTTDLLSRGIDIPLVNMVINYDLPANKETYIHRIGRCGRFDKKGIAINLVRMNNINDTRIFNRLKYTYKINIQELPESFEKYL
jgi:translation initiation factor 4A